MIDKRIRFDEKVVSEDYETITYYFIAPKEMLCNKYPDAETTEISVEVPMSCPEAKHASVCISPSKYVSEDEGYTDYDWTDISLPYDEIEELISLAEKTINKSLTKKVYRIKKRESFLSRLKPVDLEIWSEPDEHRRVTFLGMREGRQVYEDLKSQLEKTNLLKNLDYITLSKSHEGKLPENYHIKSYVNWGGSEGVYVDVTLLNTDTLTERKFIVAKTLGRTVKDYEIMGRLATAIAYLLHC